MRRSFSIGGSRSYRGGLGQPRQPRSRQGRRRNPDTGGIIISIKPEGDQLRVTFKPDKHRERESWCEDTNHIIGWFPSGQPYYEQKCGEGGMITVDLTHQPLLVPATLGAALKPGQFVRWLVDTSIPVSGETAHGIPMEIWNDADKKRLIGYAGLAL